MGASVNALTLPGSTKLSTGAPGLGGIAITEGAASSLVVSASTLSLRTRRRIPDPAKTAAMRITTTTAIMANRPETASCSGADSWSCAGCTVGGWFILRPGSLPGFKLISFVIQLLRLLVELIESHGRASAKGMLPTPAEPAVDN